MVKDIWLAAILSVHFFCSCDVFSLSCFIPCGCRSAAAFWITVTSLFLLCLCFARFYRLFFFIAAMMFPYPHRVSSVQLSVCDSFLNYGYFSLSFVKEREQRKSSGEAFLLPRSCPSPGSVKPHPGIGYPMPPAAPEMRCCDIACNAALK